MDPWMTPWTAGVGLVVVLGAMIMAGGVILDREGSQEWLSWASGVVVVLLASVAIIAAGLI
jgi:hypothetical protein